MTSVKKKKGKNLDSSSQNEMTARLHLHSAVQLREKKFTELRRVDEFHSVFAVSARRGKQQYVSARNLSALFTISKIS